VPERTDKPSYLRPILIFSLFAALALAAVLSLIPTGNGLPDTDSGVFLYFGQQILKGHIPYRDMWDHKGPVVYYINALGLFIGQGSIWGVYLLEYISLLCSLMLAYSVTARAFGPLPAFFASVLLLCGYFYVIENGNFTEEFTLPLSFAAVYLYWRSLDRKTGWGLLYIFLIGVIFSISFLLRPNNTGVAVSIALTIFITGILASRKYGLAKEIPAFALGAAAILAAVLLYFKSEGALGYFYDSFIRYNLFFSTNTAGHRLGSVFNGLRTLWHSGLPAVALTGWIIGLVTTIAKPDLGDRRTVLVCVGLIGLPVELALSGISGRTPSHYYINWLPALTILTACMVSEFLRNFSGAVINLAGHKTKLSHLWVLSFLIVLSILPLLQISYGVRNFARSGGLKNPPVSGAVKRHLNDGDYLLMWGAEAGVNYLTGAASPTRYVYQYPFYTCGYSSAEMIDEFLGDIARNKPLIVDTSSTNEVIPPLDSKERKAWKYVPKAGYAAEPCPMNPKMKDVFEYIDRNYELVDSAGQPGWKIYGYKSRP